MGTIDYCIQSRRYEKTNNSYADSYICPVHGEFSGYYPGYIVPREECNFSEWESYMEIQKYYK